MKNPYEQFAVWGRIGGRLGQRLLLKAKNRKPKKRGPGRPKNPKKQRVVYYKKRPAGAFTERNKAIADMFTDENATLESVGAKFSITRERVRQILLKMGVSHEDGRLYKTITGRMMSDSAKKETARQLRMERSCKRYLDCTIDAYTDITGKKWARWGLADKRAHSYWYQKHSADSRGIPWELTFPKWCEIWADSGKLDRRGRGQGNYVMARYGDTGAYTEGNVMIIPAVENNSDRVEKTSGLPMGVSKRGNKFRANKMVYGKQYHIGLYATPELAHAAYLEFQPAARKLAASAKRNK